MSVKKSQTRARTRHIRAMSMDYGYGTRTVLRIRSMYIQTITILYIQDTFSIRLETGILHAWHRAACVCANVQTVYDDNMYMCTTLVCAYMHPCRCTMIIYDPSDSAFSPSRH